MIAESKPKGVIEQESAETAEPSEQEDATGDVEAVELEEDQASTDA